MKAALLTGPGTFEVREVPAPAIGHDHDVLLRTKLVGICGSDLHYFSLTRVGDLDLRYPVRLGHECAAVVEAVGPGVTKLKRGDVVSVEPAVSCGTCDLCLAGRPHTCRHLRFMGSPGQLDGALAEFLVMPERNCHPLPAGMNPVLGVVAEPLSIGLWAVELAGRVEVKTVAVLGAGPIGLSVCLGARVEGARTIYVTEKVKARLAAAKDAGADWTGNPLHADVAAEILRFEPLGLDLVFECCGKQEALDQAVRLLKPGGTLVVVGIPVEERVSFDSSKLRRKEIRIQNVRRQNACLEKALGLLAGGTINADFMATHTFPLERVQDAFETVFNYRDGVVKATISLE
ncbi:MAG TPA: alcohol dehydrogenase catalytic domain-containing protein [Acidobacteriota bacterium]|nr:alcohol dehydrogenase catalytic domain-containing protein [Acidobacteriota bacterium]